MITRYHPLLRLLHWLTAVLVAGLFVAGGWIVYFDPGDGPLKERLYFLHESTGMLVWLLALARVLVRRIAGAPPLPEGTPRAVRLIAWLNHMALYGLLLVQPLLGLADANAWGAPLNWYGLFEVPWFFGKTAEPVAQTLSLLHWLGAILLAQLLLMHIAGAAYHIRVRRDGGLRRML